ncbi:hypothetical protein NQZ68_022471 [Dissostichus eleginoides]|nr:hypothetical protein NQZ68_022471 [Dissostichus eleginoides]
MWSRPGGRHYVALLRAPRRDAERLTASPESALEASPRSQPNLRWHPLSPQTTPVHGRPGGTRAARRLKVHRQPHTHRGEPDGAFHARTRRPGRERRKKGVCANGEEGGPGAHATAPDIPKRLHLGGRRRPRPPATPQPRRNANVFRLMAKRPSDRRSPGRNPGPQGAFEVSMINVSCNSHQFSQLAAFFIDARAE